MAVEIGVNAGFVTTAPSADPGGGNSSMDTRSRSQGDTSPSNAIKITEVGWWCDTATQESNFEIGLYSDDSQEEPNIRLYVDDTNAKGTTAGWKRVTVDWNIDGNTAYWIGVQLDDTATTTRTNLDIVASFGNALLTGQTSLPSDWGTSTFKDTTSTFAFYAVWEAAAGVTRKIKISGTFQDKPIKTKVGGTFVDKPIKIKVGGTFQDA